MSYTEQDLPGQKGRIDRWLWCARFYKSRSLASRAVAGGKVHVNGERVKPARAISLGDQVSITRGPHRLELIVRGLPERRGPAAESQRCYEETPSSIAQRVKLCEQHALAAAFAPRPESRPHKRARRLLLKLRRQQ
jgi:ribosome-associated heat shock protein Hsp15